MMTHTHNLLSQRQVVESFLADTPEDEILERNSWLARLQSLDAQIEAEQKQVVPARSSITFAGPPVVASYGIASTFGMAATRAYTNIVQVLAAQWLRADPLGRAGPLRNAAKFDLLVVDRAYGSFGFEMEEPTEAQLTFDERSILTQSLEKTQQILRGALTSDDALDEAIADLDKRVLTAVRTFLKILDNNDATCTIQSGDHEFRFDSEAQVNESRVRLEWKNIKREEVEREGQFVGARPGPGDFEFQVAQDAEFIVGRINPDVADVAEINAHLYQRARVRLFVQQVGNARPRYVLMQNPDWL